MAGIETRSRAILIAMLCFCLFEAGCLTGGTKTAKNQKGKKAGDLSAAAEPDKILYDRAMADMKKSRFTEGRLSLQTLINTYPDSEYLAKAKLAQADSYYKEGGTTNLTQSIQEYKDFITFFPFLDEASYAQMQVAMAHHKMMEKSDRDNSQAIGAEDEFQAFLLKYPQSPLAPQAEQRLREVQEVLADGEFRIAHFYYIKQDYRASAARLVEVTDRYPLYSGSDEALWMLGDVYQRAKQASRNEDDKNHWSDLAAKCYDRILQNYPMSKHAGEAKGRLTSMGMPVPAADPDAAARMKKEQLYAKAHRPNPLKQVAFDVLKSSPDVHTAAHSGAPNLNPPTDAISATDVLKPGAAGPSFGVTASNAADSSAGDSGAVDEGSSGVSAAGTGPTAAAGAQIIAAPGAVAPGTPAVPSNAPSANAPAPNSGPASQPAASAPNASAPPSGSTAAPASAGTAPAGSAPAPASSTGSADGQPKAASGDQKKSDSDDSQKESSSKKKKGLRKIIPW